MSKRVCKICLEPEETHHKPDWIEVPDGCVCDLRTWDTENLTAIPPACSEYQGNGVENCHKCEHDKACHKGAK